MGTNANGWRGAPIKATEEAETGRLCGESSAETIVLATDRLLLRRFRADDAPFILALVNDPSWLRYIGDKGVRSPDDARRYIENGPAQMYKRRGFGLYLAESKATGQPLGMCGLVKRKQLDDVDLGFAFLPQFRRKGYALEAASAVLAHARGVLRLPRIVAVCAPDNVASALLLGRLGFSREKTVRLESGGEALDLYIHQPATRRSTWQRT